MNQQYAQGIAALGRGPDTMLVHMAPQEVAGLQALALKHGGSLTINPETGLPEAGFLSSILPMVAGFALNAFAPGLGTAVGGMFGMGSAAGTALTVGGISALASGSLSKGLMAGLGAYGGAGLGESLMGAGAAAIPSAAGAAQVPIGAVVPEAVLPAAAQTTAQVALPTAAQTAVQAAPITAVPTVPAIPATVTPSPILPTPTGPVPTVSPYGDFARFDRALSPGLNASPMDKLGAGFKAVTASPSAAFDFAKSNVMPLGALGISALSGLDDKKVDTAKDPGMIRPYTYSREKVPGAFMDVAGEPLSSKERRYFTDRYTALTPYKAPGPEYMAAEGGPVEAMSNGNNIAAYMGQDKFAEGGSIGGYTFDPKTGIYTKPSGEGATVASPTGGASRASGEGDGENPLNPQVAAFLDKETPGERNERMENVSNVIGMLVPGGMALQAAGNLVSGLLSSPTVGAIANFFGGTQTPAPVVDAVGKSVSEINNPTGSSPGAQQGDTPADGGGGDWGDTSNMAAKGGLMALAQGGMSNLGDYSDGGRLLRGPGDGVSDDIPAMIGQKQQARLADGEFVVPARIVSELGNGSTEAGARQLYAMMDRVQKARKKTVGKDKVATNSRAAKLLPA